MADSRLADIADILPPLAPPDGSGELYWLLLGALSLLLPLCWLGWRWWQRRGRLRWRLRQLGSAVRRRRLEIRVAADRLSAALAGRVLDEMLRQRLDQARFAADSISPEDFLGLLQQLDGAGHGD